MKKFFKVLEIFMLWITIYGIIGPYMVSAKSNILVLVGLFAVFVIGPLTTWVLGKQLFEDDK